MAQEDEIAVANHRLASTRAVVNVINLVRQFDSFNPQDSSLLLRDPYPEHASNTLNRAARSIVSLTSKGTITPAVAAVLASTVLQGLLIVSQISFSAADYLPILTLLFRDHGILTHVPGPLLQDPTNGATSVLLDSAITSEMLETETLKELGQQAIADPSLVLKSIERHEMPASTPDFGLDYLQYIDFTAVAGAWDFEDCFAGG